MSAIPASVIVVSRFRPDRLMLCLESLCRQDHARFEILLVADPGSVGLRPDLPLKRISFDAPNIAEARNLGLSEAAGDVVAFIDDDAVAEPCWLSALCAPFQDPRVVAATGWTRDRDGIAYQVQAQMVDGQGRAVDLDPAPRPRLLESQPGLAVSTLGTNCAFRASSLREIGGFDPAFSWHLDESDVNLRMARAFPGALTAIIPTAQVLHARAGSAVRRGGAPVDLRVQGRSTMIFQRRHGAPEPDLPKQQRKRLLRHMVDGKLDPFQIAPILRGLEAGIEEGRSGDLPPPPDARQDRPAPLAAITGRARPDRVISGWHWQARRLRKRAADAARRGDIVTLILLTPTFLPHRVHFTRDGFFEQRGGLWGASGPEEPIMQPWRYKNRINQEVERTKRRRGSLVASSELYARPAASKG